MNKKEKNNIALAIGVIALVIICVFLFRKPPVAPPANNQISDITTGWKIFSDPVKGITFKYPENLETSYINAVDWPPKVQIQDGSFACLEAGKETEQSGQTKLENINNKNYCVTKETEGAAGSTYTQYAYVTEIQNKLVSFTFSLRFIQCGNYEEPKKTACENERKTFNIDNTIDKIAQTTALL